jgi:hypothetical protein
VCLFRDLRVKNYRKHGKAPVNPATTPMSSHHVDFEAISTPPKIQTDALPMAPWWTISI